MNTKTPATKTPRVICPKLVDPVTGASRITNKTYLAEKAERLNTSVENLVKFYASKETLAALRKDATYGNLDPKFVKKVLAFNGKAPKAKAPKVVKTVAAEAVTAPAAEPVVA